MTTQEELIMRFVTAVRQDFHITCGGYVEPSMGNGRPPTIPPLEEFKQIVEAKEKEVQERSDQRSQKINCVRTTLQKILDKDQSTIDWLLVGDNRLKYFIDLLVPPPIRKIKLFDIDGNTKDFSGEQMFQFLQEQVRLDGVEHLTLTMNSDIYALIMKYD